MNQDSVIIQQFPTPYDQMSDDEKTEVGILVASGEVNKLLSLTGKPFQDQEILVGISQSDLEVIMAAIDDLSEHPERQSAVAAKITKTSKIDWPGVLEQSRDKVSLFLQERALNPEKVKAALTAETDPGGFEKL